MAKSREKKSTEVRELVGSLGTSKAVVFADISGLKVNQNSALRRKAEKEQVSVALGKKTLLRVAFKEAGATVDVDSLPGSVSLFFGLADEVAAAKIVADARKEHESVKILGGILENSWVSAQQVDALAKLPSKEQLIAQVVGTIRAPLSGLVNVLQGNLRGLVQVLGAIKESKS